MGRRDAITQAAVIIGCGELGSAVARELHRSGFATVLCDDVDPTVMRRGLSYADAWYVGEAELEETTAIFCSSARSIPTILTRRDVIAATTWSWAAVTRLLPTIIVVDARTVRPATEVNLMERLGTDVLTVGAGSWYRAGVNARAVLRVRDDAGRPGVGDLLAGESFRRPVLAMAPGRFTTDRRVGDYVMSGEAIGAIGRTLVYAGATGVLSGLLPRGARVPDGVAVLEVDVRGQPALCFAIPDAYREVARKVVAHAKGRVELEVEPA